MAGSTIRLLPRTDYKLLAQSFIGGKDVRMVFARRIDTSQWREAILLARVHAVSPWNAGAQANLEVALDAYTEEDPSAIWAPPPTSLVTFIQGTDTPPAAKNAGLTSPFGPLVLFQWKLVMATTPIDTTYSVSVDLNLKGD